MRIVQTTKIADDRRRGCRASSETRALTPFRRYRRRRGVRVARLPIPSAACPADYARNAFYPLLSDGMLLPSAADGTRETVSTRVSVENIARAKHPRRHTASSTRTREITRRIRRDSVRAGVYGSWPFPRLSVDTSDRLGFF